MRLRLWQAEVVLLTCMRVTSEGVALTHNGTNVSALLDRGRPLAAAQGHQGPHLIVCKDAGVAAKAVAGL